jgi:alanine racemase
MVYADQPDNPMNDVQAQRLSAMLAQARNQGVQFDVAHLSNSAATISRPDLAFDMVRPGIAVYGLSPVPNLGDMGLIPAMTVKCVVALVKSVCAGEGVSYGHTWIADRDTTVALMPVGYADGVFRALGGRLDVLINGRRRPGVGRVCMDQFVVDLGPGPVDVTEGDEAILFGPGTRGEPTAQDWADLLDTIHYEVVTSPRGRIVRTYREAETLER